MKKLMTLLVLVFATSLFMTSCGDDTKTTSSTTTTHETPKEEAPKEEAPKADEHSSAAGDVEKGKELFAAKTCSACHAIDKKVVGPSVKDIAAKYAAGGSIADFLSGKADAIVDTDPAQVTMMKENLATILKDASAEDLANYSAYIMSVK